ncbi:hypothetical protein SAMN04515669_5285 [Jiangella sp. DSM 45060]|nr:hypothetical protein SAMN04515669_5285 [Jiangella sp. DSM 45060]
MRRPGLADRVQAAGPTATQGNGTQRTGDLALLNMAYLLEVRATASAGKRLDRTLHIAARTGS